MLKLGSRDIFFDLLDNQASVAIDAAQEFLAMVRDLKNIQGHARKLAEIETRGDDLTHELQNKVTGTFITPLDQEDLVALSNVLDDITDFIEATGARMVIYRLSEPRKNLDELAQELVKITDLVGQAVAFLRHRFGASPTLREVIHKIHTSENDSDLLFRDALSALFDETTDAIAVMKWKEVFDRIETAIDRCEDVAKMLDNLIIKYA